MRLGGIPGIKSSLEQINRQGSSSLPDSEMRGNPQTRHEEIETSIPDRTTIRNQADAASTSVSHTKHEITGASTFHSADPAEQITQALSEIQSVKVELSWTTKRVDEMREKLCLSPEEHRPQRMKKKFKQLSDVSSQSGGGGVVEHDQMTRRLGACKRKPMRV